MGKESGWIKLHRKLLDCNFWKNEKFSKGQAWVDMLLLAARKDRSFVKRGIVVNEKVGQLGYSMVQLSKRWHWNNRTVYKYLENLKKLGMIEYTCNRVTTLISITNYAKYQITDEDYNCVNTNELKVEKKAVHNKIGKKYTTEYTTEYITKNGSNNLNINDIQEDNKKECITEYTTECIAKVEKSAYPTRIIKENKNINNKKENKEKRKFDFSSCPEALIPVVEKWFAYKAQRKQSYTSQVGVTAFINRLVKFSNGELSKANEIVDCSIANNYQGIFEIKNQQNYGRDKKTRDGKIPEPTDEFIETKL